jgi:predicted nucleic acid-binding protein
MICLDTNYLIRGLAKGSPEAAQLIAWTRSGETLVTSTVSWFEFICGPVSRPQVETIRAFLNAIIPFDEEHAAQAARLFNAAGRRRSLRVGSMIAGTASASGARLATTNPSDFQLFVAHGVSLV